MTTSARVFSILLVSGLIACAPDDDPTPLPTANDSGLDFGQTHGDVLIQDAMAEGDVLIDGSRPDLGRPQRDHGAPMAPDISSHDASADSAMRPVDLGTAGDAARSQDAQPDRLPDMATVPDMAMAPDISANEAEMLLPPCEEACCPGRPWRRPGGFWSNLAGHAPDWRPVEEAACVFGMQRDECERVTRYTLGRAQCEAHACDPCRENLNEYRRLLAYAYDAGGNIILESSTVRRHIDWSEPTTIRHTYDERGLRAGTTGYFLPEEGRPSSLYLRYFHDEAGRLIREEAVHDPFHDFEPVPWSPTRISDFVYRGEVIEERLDSNADGEIDQVLEHAN